MVDTEDEPIRGLYAAGELVGGIFYFNYPGGSGLINGTVFGRIAGRNAAEMLQAGLKRQVIRSALFSMMDHFR